VRIGIAAAVVLGAWLASAVARAEGPSIEPPGGPGVEALIKRGIELREQGKDDWALELFKQADALVPSPRTKAQVGLAEQALGIWVAAEGHVEAALAAKDDAWIERYRGALENALATIKKHVGTLEVRGGVPGGDVLVDGAKVGTLPMTAPWRVEVGRRAIEVRAAGYHSASRATDIVAGATTRETFQLVKEDAVAEPSRAGGAAIDASASAPGAVQRTMGWVFVGTGGAALVLGVVGIVARQSTVSGYNEDTTCPGLGSANQPAECQDRISTADTWRTVSIASFIAGGVLGVGGAVLVLTAPSSPRAPASARLACGPLGAGVACGGTF
jgi:hypothetical protein